MKQLFRFAVSITLLCVFTINVCAWNKVGHMTVAGIAYRELQRNDQAKLDRINTLLRSHAAYGTSHRGWVQEYNGYSQAIKNEISLEAYAFMRAAAWPDDVRNQSDDRPPWHFINYPVRLPNTVDEDHPIGNPVNILTAFTAQAGILTDNGPSNSRKAKSLSWIFHLVGDIHQPLHGAALVNTHFTGGDHGGNFICVHAASQPNTDNLHSFWDNVLRANGSARVNGGNAWADAAFFRGLIGNAAIGNATGSEGMEIWAKDSANIALRSAYQFHGATPDFLNVNRRNTCPQGGSVSEEYESEATDIARRRMVLGGLRLAQFLRSVF